MSMYRSVLHLKTAIPKTLKNRSFVSTVLLTRSWENETYNDLKKEIKKKGLSAKGNKASLITRIQEYDKQLTLEAVSARGPPVPASLSVRRASSVSPGIPLAAQPMVSVPNEFRNIQLPDISQPEVEPPIQIPFVPDFWDSSKLQVKPEEPSSEPKILVVSGSATHQGGGPSYNLSNDHEAQLHAIEDHAPSFSSQPSSFWRGVAEDLSLPSSFRWTPRGSNELPETVGNTGTRENYSRPLNAEERKGLWMLLGTFAGAWIGGKILDGRPDSDEQVKERH